MISVLGNEWSFHVVFISGDGHGAPESEGLIVLVAAGREQPALRTDAWIRR